MFVIAHGTGRVGSATAEALLAARQRVCIVTRSEAKGRSWRQRGTEVAVCDVRDVDALRSVFRRARRAFLLNPPADPALDTDRTERETVRCLVAALEGSGLEKVVALSTYGARKGERCGDLTVLHELEEALRAQPLPATILRAAYMMSNWDAGFEAARAGGALPSMLPRDLVLPMVAPKDIGADAARRLEEPVRGMETQHVEGPERYTPADVAAALARALERPVHVEVIARERWREAFRGFGFSEEAADSYARMTAITVDEPLLPSSPLRGAVSLASYVREATR